MMPTLFFQTRSIEVNTEVSAWQLIAVIVAFAMAWAVVAYRVNRHGSYHQTHFDHEKQMNPESISKSIQIVAQQARADTRNLETKLIGELGRVEQRIDDAEKNVTLAVSGLREVVTTQMDNMCDRITDLSDTLRRRD